MPKGNSHYEGVIMPDDYQDVIYRLTYHCLGKVAPFIPARVPPNLITLAAFISAIVGCVCLFFIRSPAGFLYWAAFNFIWYLLDALDGIHARLTHQTSEFGAFLDHFLDNVFFLVMFSVFFVRFDLGYAIFMIAIFLRFTAATNVFIVQHHTGKLHLSKFSGGGELILMTLVMILSYCYPGFNPALHTSNSALLYWIHLLHLEQGMFMKLTLIIYLIGIPINLFLMYRFTIQELIQQKTQALKKLDDDEDIVVN